MNLVNSTTIRLLPGQFLGGWAQGTFYNYLHWLSFTSMGSSGILAGAINFLPLVREARRRRACMIKLAANNIIYSSLSFLIFLLTMNLMIQTDIIALEHFGQLLIQGLMFNNNQYQIIITSWCISIQPPRKAAMTLSIASNGHAETWASINTKLDERREHQ